MRPIGRTSSNQRRNLTGLGKRLKRGIAATGISAAILWGGEEKIPTPKQLYHDVNRCEISAMNYLDPEFSASDSVLIKDFQKDLKRKHKSFRQPTVVEILIITSSYGVTKEGVGRAIAEQESHAKRITILKERLKGKNLSRDKEERIRHELFNEKFDLDLARQVEKILQLAKNNPGLVKFFKHLSEQPYLSQQLYILRMTNMY